MDVYVAVVISMLLCHLSPMGYHVRRWNDMGTVVGNVGTATCFE